MNKRLRIHIHPIFWLIAAFSVLIGQFWELLSLFIIVFIHEMGHALMARFYKWKIKRVIILPFGGYCEVDEHGNRPLKEELLVILAGPIQHVFIAIILFVLKVFSIIHVEYAEYLMRMNLIILLFNLLPIWPLDGGRCLQIIFSLKQSYIKSLKQTLQISFAALALITILIISQLGLQPQLLVVILYLSITLYTSWKKRHYQFIRFLLERHYGKNIDLTAIERIEATPTDQLIDVMEQFRRGNKHIISIKEKDEREQVYDENEILYAYFSEKQVHAQMKDLRYLN